jgi:hypothetical protein
MPRFTVVSFVEETGQIFVDHVVADDPGDAVVMVAIDRCVGYGMGYPLDPYDISIVSIFAGYHDDLNGDESIGAAGDFPGVKETIERLKRARFGDDR